MSAANAARALLASVAGFTAPPVGPTSDAGSSNQPVRLATIDTAFTGSTQNLLNNPSGRRSITGYVILGTGNLGNDPAADTYAQCTSATSIPPGNFGVVVESMAVGAKLAANTTYTFSATIYGSTGRAQIYVTGAASVSFPTSGPSGAFTRVSGTFTTPSSGTLNFYVLNGEAIISGGIVAFRDAQVELGSIATPYADGSIAGTAWLGAADNSISSTPVLPKVLFDGETVMGARTYALLVPCYAGQRVALLPVGHSYIILGGIAATPSTPVASGTIIEGLWTAAPSGFLMLDGSVLTRATYPALFAVLGTTYNTGGETALQFRVPDFRGAVLAQKNAATFATLGAKGGEEMHTLTVAETPSHTHQWAPNTGNVTSGSSFTTGIINAGGGGIQNTSATGGGGAHNNLQPYAVVNRAIKT